MKYKKTIIAIAALELQLTIKQSFGKEIDVSLYPPLNEIIFQHPSIAKTFIHIRNNTNYSLSIKPTLYELKMSNYNQIIAPLELNHQNQPIITIGNEDNSIALLQWPRIDEKIKDDILLVLSPYEEKNITVTVQVNSNTKKEDFYRAITFNTTPDTSNENSSSITNSLGSLLLIANQPQKAADIKLQEFSTSFIHNDDPLQFKIKLENSQKTYGKVYGYIKIKDLFGTTRLSTTLEPKIILSEQTSFISNQKNNIYEIENNFVGFYTAEIQLKNLNSKVIANRETSFITLPLQIWILISFFVFFLLLIYLRVRRKLDLKRKKQR